MVARASLWTYSGRTEDVNTEPFSSLVIEYIITVNRVLGRSQIAQIFIYCLHSLDIRLNYYFTFNEQRTELHNNKS